LSQVWREAFAARLTPFRKVLVAVSGGPDSVALLDLARSLPNLDIIAATVDHGIRPEAKREIAVVAGLCKAWHIPHRVLKITDAPPARGLLEWGRRERYALLIRIAKHEACDALMVAHHQDDQAETLLHRLASGSGPAGLSGMAMQMQRDGYIVMRPLLDVPKAALIAHCQREALPFINDPTNGNQGFMRARLRRARPVLEQEGLTAQRLATLAKRMARVNEALDARVADVVRAVRQPHGSIDWTLVRSEPTEIRLRLLKQQIDLVRSIHGLAGPVSMERLESLLYALDASRLGQRISRSIGGLSLRLETSGLVKFAPEPPRKRGRKTSASR
jgi:tRNA(Ile)-lysidine synthase